MQNEKRYKVAAFCVLFCLIAIAVITVICIKGCSDTTDKNQSATYSGVKWNGENHNTQQADNSYAYIPGFTKLTFRAGTTHQNVNFHNPEQNIANANLTLKLSDGTVLWEEKNVKPGYGFYDIELNKPLSKGIYNASLVYGFSSDSGAQYNGGIVPFKLTVE